MLFIPAILLSVFLGSSISNLLLVIMLMVILICLDLRFLCLQVVHMHPVVVQCMVIGDIMHTMAYVGVNHSRWVSLGSVLVFGPGQFVFLRTRNNNKHSGCLEIDSL